MGRIFADPAELDAAAERYKTGAQDVAQIVGRIDGSDLPDCPGHVRAEVQAQLSLALDDLRGLVPSIIGDGYAIRATAERFRRTSDDPGLGVALTEIDRMGKLREFVMTPGALPGEKKPWDIPQWAGVSMDALVGFSAGYLVRPGRWEVVQRHVSPRGRVTYVPKRNLGPRLAMWPKWAMSKIPGSGLPEMKRRLYIPKGNHVRGQRFLGAEHWAKALRIAGSTLSAVIAGFNERQENMYDLTVSDAEHRKRYIVAGASEGGGALAGAGLGAAACGTAFAPTGPGAIVAGGVCGTAGAFIGAEGVKKIRNWILDW